MKSDWVVAEKLGHYPSRWLFRLLPRVPDRLQPPPALDRTSETQGYDGQGAG